MRRSAGFLVPCLAVAALAATATPLHRHVRRRTGVTVELRHGQLRVSLAPGGGQAIRIRRAG